MDKRCLILDKKNHIICSGDISFEGMTKAIIQPDYKSVIKKLKKSKCVRFQIKEEYNGMYDSNFDKYDEKKVYVSNIKNISSNLKDDMRVQINYVGDVMYELDGCVYSVPVKMQDISSTGMRFLCRISLAKELNYQIVMPWTVEPLIIEFNILRKMDTIGDKEFIYSYECKFIKINYLEGKMLKEGEFQVESLNYKNKDKSTEVK